MIKTFEFLVEQLSISYLLTLVDLILLRPTGEIHTLDTFTDIQT